MSSTSCKDENEMQKKCDLWKAEMLKNKLKIWNNWDDIKSVSKLYDSINILNVATGHYNDVDKDFMIDEDPNIYIIQRIRFHLIEIKKAVID